MKFFICCFRKQNFLHKTTEEGKIQVRTYRFFSKFYIFHFSSAFSRKRHTVSYLPVPLLYCDINRMNDESLVELSRRIQILTLTVIF